MIGYDSDKRFSGWSLQNLEKIKIPRTGIQYPCAAYSWSLAHLIAGGNLTNTNAFCVYVIQKSQQMGLKPLSGGKAGGRAGTAFISFHSPKTDRPRPEGLRVKSYENNAQYPQKILQVHCGRGWTALATKEWLQSYTFFGAPSTSPSGGAPSARMSYHGIAHQSWAAHT